MQKSTAAVIFLALSWAWSPFALADQLVLTAPGSVRILGLDNVTTSAVVSNVTLTLTKADAAQNTPYTNWAVTYQYYNGAYYWEYHQYLSLLIFGCTQTPRNGVGCLINAGYTPSTACRYGAGITARASGTGQFYLSPGATFSVGGSTGNRPNNDRRDHKC